MNLKIIEKPTVYPVGIQQVNVPALDAFLCDEGFPAFQSDAKKACEELVEIAGRLCYMSFKKPRPGGNEAYIGHILEVGHGSVTEHAVFNFIVTGVSRSLTHEFVRHRVGFSYSQLSQRYVDESDVAFVVPPAYIPADGFVGLSYRQWRDACESALSDYRELLRLSEPDASGTTASTKQVREAARSVLPNCTETKIFVTGNARALRHFVELRGDAGADAEIRRLAFAFLDILAVQAPHLFGDLEIVPVDGVETIHSPHRKV